MKLSPWPLSRYLRISRLCGLTIIALAGSALLGWFTGSTFLKGFRASYIPMAPNTVLVFLLLGAILATLKEEKKRVLLFGRLAATFTFLLVGTRLAEFSTGLQLSVDHWFFRFPAESLGLAPVGKMAFYTAATFLLLSTSLFFATLAHRPWANNVSKGLALTVAFVGAAFSLGYVYGAPLLYGGQSIPMALNTALCFLLGGASLLIKGSSRDIAERRQAKEELQRAHDELEEKVRARTADLTRAVSLLEAEIAERKQTEAALRASEEQLRQSQKLEGVGRLAGGIAHDFNNLLTVILGNCDLLVRKSGFDEKTLDRINGINGAAKRASALTRQLLAFSRKQVLKPELLDINLLVEGISNMLARLIGEDIELVTALKHRGKVMADPGQIEQVLTNLVVNARDAMPNGGKITIETADVELDLTYADMHITVKPGRYVMLAVSDTGCGMDAETRRQIFEPFFTTKEVGKGTGLGLSMIYGIVKQSGGTIWVYSEVGRGTTFKIYLPHAVVDAGEQPVKRQLPARLDSPCTETILLVEDEAMVRSLTSDILRSQGYQLLVAENGLEAIELCRRHTGPIHLLLSDVVMPQMNGREVANHIKLLRPEIEVLFTSGYTDDAISLHGVLEKGAFFIEKPFTADGILGKVREVLSQELEVKI